MKRDKCPCENCIVLAICRHKLYVQLFMDCELLKAYVTDYFIVGVRDDSRVYQLQNTINPTAWIYGMDGSGKTNDCLVHPFRDGVIGSPWGSNK